MTSAPREIPPAKPFRAGQPIYQFLRERGACPHLGATRVVEVLLADGDAVEVSGTAEEAAVPVGYRDTGFDRVFRDRPGSPLLVRVAAEE